MYTEDQLRDLQVQPRPFYDTNVKPIKVADLTKLHGVITHPRMPNMLYFFTEYARALQIDMIRYPDKYGKATFEDIYDRMSVAIANDEVNYKDSPAIQHACRAAGIPCTSMYVQAYLWWDQPISLQLVDIRKKYGLANIKHGRSIRTHNKPPREIRLPPTLKTINESNVRGDSGQQTPNSIPGSGELQT